MLMLLWNVVVEIKTADMAVLDKSQVQPSNQAEWACGTEVHHKRQK